MAEVATNCDPARFRLTSSAFGPIALRFVQSAAEFWTGFGPTLAMVGQHTEKLHGPRSGTVIDKRSAASGWVEYHRARACACEFACATFSSFRTHIIPIRPRPHHFWHYRADLGHTWPCWSI